MDGPWNEKGMSIGSWINEYCTRGSARTFDQTLYDKCLSYWSSGRPYEELRWERRPNWGEPEAPPGPASSSPLRGGGGGLKSFKALREALEASASQPQQEGRGLGEKQPEGAAAEPEKKQQEDQSMVELAAEKRALLSSYGLKVDMRGRFPRKVNAAKLLSKLAKEEGWDGARLAAALQKLEPLQSKIEQQQRRLREFASQEVTLERYNEWLRGYKLPEEDTLAKARAALSKLFVSLYDLMAGVYTNFPSISALRRHIIRNELYFSKGTAKQQGINVFLKKIFLH
jgi:hypothetical protein